MLDMRSSLP